MDKLHLDFETRSRVDLKTRGVHNYVADKEFKILICGTALNDEPVNVDGGYKMQDATLLRSVTAFLEETDGVLIAHNASFERAIVEATYKRKGWQAPKLTRWRCTKAKAAYHGLPLALGGCALALGLTKQKDTRGTLLINKFCVPNAKTGVFTDYEDSPEAWDAFVEYNRTDVEVERQIDHALPDLPPLEQVIWTLDQMMNDKGLRVDVNSVHEALKVIQHFTDVSLREFKELVEDEFESPSQAAKLRAWLGRQGVHIDNVQKETIARLMEDETLPSNVRRALTIRQEVSRTSLAKINAIGMFVNQDHRVRANLEYHGAGTGRWSGRGIQIQNFVKRTVSQVEVDNGFKALAVGKDWFLGSTDNPAELLSSMLRGFIIAPRDKWLYVADYNAIEVRVLAWIAREPALLELFAKKIDPYKWMAGRILHKPPGEVTPQERNTLGKPSVLGCGFQMGPPRFASQYNVGLELAEQCVTVYRESFPNIKNFWSRVNAVAMEAVNSTQPQHVFQTRGPNITFQKVGRFLQCVLPSGRAIHYCDPEVRIEMNKFGNESASLYYWGVDSTTKQWCLESTYGGKLTENLVQAIARDIMAWGMLNVQQHPDFELLTCVHDETLAEGPRGDEENRLNTYVKLLEKTPQWADGLPIVAEGWFGDRYKKG